MPPVGHVEHVIPNGPGQQFRNKRFNRRQLLRKRYDGGPRLRIGIDNARSSQKSADINAGYTVGQGVRKIPPFRKAWARFQVARVVTHRKRVTRCYVFEPWVFAHGICRSDGASVARKSNWM